MLLNDTLFTSKGLFALLLTVVAISWVVATCFLEPMPLPDGEGGGGGISGASNETSEQLITRAQKKGWRRLVAVLELTFTDARALGLAPLNISFGFIIVFFASYVDRKTIAEHIGEYAIG